MAMTVGDWSGEQMAGLRTMRVIAARFRDRPRAEAVLQALRDRLGLPPDQADAAAMADGDEEPPGVLAGQLHEDRVPHGPRPDDDPGVEASPFRRPADRARPGILVARQPRSLPRGRGSTLRPLRGGFRGN